MEFKSAHFLLPERSYLNLIKREVHHMAAAAGFGNSRLAELDIIIAEITSNLVKHTGGKGGELIVQLFRDRGEDVLEVIGIDNGPGMSDPVRIMQNRISTTGTLGQGLGAIKRLSDQSDLYSIFGWGTILLSRLYKTKPKTPNTAPAPKMDIRAVMVNKPGETACGDGWVFRQSGNQYWMLCMDGLGHGAEAHKAVALASEEFLKIRNESSPSQILKQLHLPLKKTRGIVALLAVLDTMKKTVTFCGVGNILGRMFTEERQTAFVSYNGIIGHVMPNTIHDKIVNFEKNSAFILCSDGIKGRWELNKYPGLFKHDNSIIASAIYKDHCRKTDDSLVVVACMKN